MKEEILEKIKNLRKPLNRISDKQLIKIFGSGNISFSNACPKCIGFGLSIILESKKLDIPIGSTYEVYLCCQCGEQYEFVDSCFNH